MKPKLFPARRGSTAPGPSRPTDERQTPRWFFKLCSRLFGPIDLDCFAADWNHQVARYITREQDFFRSRLRALCAWVQPPYSRGFLDRALSVARERVLSGQYGRAVCLVPCDPSSRWWHRNVARPEGRVIEMRSLWNKYPAPLVQAFQLESVGLVITQAFPGRRLHFRGPGSQRRVFDDGRSAAGAMQPSAVVVFEKACGRADCDRHSRPPQTSAMRRAA